MTTTTAPTILHRLTMERTDTTVPVAKLETYVPDDDYYAAEAWQREAWKECRGQAWGSTPPAPEPMATMLADWTASAMNATGAAPHVWYQAETPTGYTPAGFIRAWIVRPLSTMDIPAYVQRPFMHGPHGTRRSEHGPILYSFSG